MDSKQSTQKAQEFLQGLQAKLDKSQKDQSQGFSADAVTDTERVGREAVKEFAYFAGQNAGALSLSSILDIAEALLGIIVKDANLLATLKTILAIIRKFVPVTA